MGKQVNFFFTPADLAFFESKLIPIGPLEIIPSRLNEPALEFLPDLRVAEMGKTWLTVYLVRRGDVDSVLLKHVPQQGHWVIDSRRSSVVADAHNTIREGFLRCEGV